MTEETDPLPPGRSFTILNHGQPSMTVMETPRLAPEEATEVHRLLEEMVTDRARTEPVAQRFLDSHRQLLGEIGSQALYLQTMLEDGKVGSVLVDYSPNKLKDWEKYASFVYLAEYSDFRVAPDPTTDSLFVLLAGAPLSVKIRMPMLVSGVHFDDLSAMTKTPDDRRSELHKRAQSKLDDLLQEVKRNRRTHESLQRLVGQVRAGHFDGQSIEKAEEEATRHFWSKARPKVREWLRLELEARRHPAVANPLAAYLKPGHFALLFVQAAEFPKFKEAAERACKKK